MNQSSAATVESQSAPSRAPAAPVACIDLDRFCEGCGYNLRTLPVYRDAHTGIPIVRCPECGRYQSANDASTVLRPWLHRLTSLLLGAWILVIIAAFFHLGLAEGALSYTTLDELTIRGGSTVQRINNTTIRTWSGSGPLEVRSDYEYYGSFVAMILFGSSLTAFACGMLAVVVCPHWPRAAYAGFILAMPILAGGLVAITWRYEAPHLFIWSLPYVAAHAGAQAVGGLAGVIFGRPLARLGVQIFLPPSIRPRLAYLWHADGKPFPRP